MKKILGIMGVVGLLFAGCSSEDDILSSFHNDPDAVHITAEVGKASADGFTRSNPLGDAQKQKEFNQNDEISVKADGQEAVTYKLVGEEWQPQDGKFLKWESETMNFTAYYPASYTGGAITQPTAYPDEASLIAADYMSFTDDVKNPGDNSLTLTMNRQMARVVVEIVGFNNQYASGTEVSSVTINGNVKAFKQEKQDNQNDKFYALMVPCVADNKAKFLSLEVGEGNTETLTGIPALEAGKSYTYQLTVGKNKVVVTGITVKDWTSGETLDGKTTYIPYVTFTAEVAQTFTLQNNGYFPSNIEYSVGTGEWKTLEANKKIFFGGDKGNLQLRGTNNLNGTSDYNSMSGNDNYSYISFGNEEVKVACSGDIRTLLDYKTYKTVDTSNAQFCGLFYSCNELTSAPDLPATKLANYCYKSMFMSCTSLTKAPALPAQELAAVCYEHMFYGCSSLQEAPKLSATTLAYKCYSGMFMNCTSLASAPELSATTLANYCYEQMFDGCTNLSSVTMLASSDQITSNVYCCDSWLNNAGTKEGISRKLILKDVDAYYALVDKGYLPDKWKKGNCNVLDGTPYVTFSANAAQTFKLKKENYFPSNIEYSVGTGDWKPLVENEQIPFGGDLGNLQLRGTENLQGTASDFSKYSQIIFGNSTKVACTGDIRTLLDYRDFKNVETNNARFCSLFWKCRVLTSAPELPAETLASSCYRYMFQGCLSLNVAPKLPATELAEKCYQGMFFGCESLESAPALPAETLATDCYNGMFNECSSLKVAPKLPAKKMESQCYKSMFAYCSSLESAPALPAKKMEWQCYVGMFENCSSLKVAPELPATELAERCYLAMFISCENLTTAPELPATTLQANCYDQMFNYCHKLSSITIMAPSTEISEKSFYNNFNWIEEAGTDPSVKSRTLKVQDKAAYNALVAKGLDENWQIGHCTVLAGDNSTITE